MAWHHSLPLLVFVVTFVASVLSGMTGGGGGYIITPFFIAIGLTPQQSVATVKLWALGMDSGSITAFRHRLIRHKRLALFLLSASIVIGFVSAVIIRRLANENLQLVMGILNLAAVPILFIRHHKVRSRTRHLILQGSGILSLLVIMLLQAVFASGIGSIINVFLIAIFGASALESQFMKRRASLAADIIGIVALFSSGLIRFSYGFIGMAGGLMGGYIGSKFALREGERFARYALMVFMLASGIWLIASA